MKLLPIILFCFFLPGTDDAWLTDFAQAKRAAKDAHMLILLNFSGSDWCVPCIRMHKVIFESSSFESFAARNLVLVTADFPRLSKHQLSKAQEKQNEALADKYNSAGKFPFTLLLDDEGKVLKSWEGCPDESAEQFVAEINVLVHDGK